MAKVATLKVVPNPWGHLDHLGRPAGACPMERPMGLAPGQHQGFVGAVRMATDPEKLPLGHAGTPDQDTTYVFSRAVVEVPDTTYYRSAIRNGELFAADERSARAGGVKLLPVDDALEASQLAAMERWEAAFGEQPDEVDPFAKGSV